MSAIIAQQVLAVGGNALTLSLKKDEYIRQMSIGTNWNRLHIGVLCSVGASADIYAPFLAIGVCTFGSGTQGLLAWNTTNWTGGTYNYTVQYFNPWTFNAAGYLNMLGTSGASFQPIKKVGRTISGFGGNSTTNAIPTTASGRRAIIVLQITKGSPNYTINSYGSNTAALAQVDFTYSNLMEATQQLGGTPVVGATALSVYNGGGGTTTDETAGPYDAISIAWNKLFIPFDIYGIVAYRFY